MSIDSIITFYGSMGERVFDAYVLYGRPFLDALHSLFDALFYTFLILTILISSVYGVMSLFALFRRRKHEEHPLTESRAPKVTIQIPTFNELAALRCAKACLSFDYPKEKMQIIIGDDSHDAKVSEKIDAFAAEHGLLVTRRGNNLGYKAGNLNHMLKRSTGDIIVIFDSDFIPGKDFLRRIVSPFQRDASLSAVQARWRFLDRNRNLVTVLGSTIVTVFHQVCLPFLHRQHGISFLCGSAEAVRKKDLIAAGGWESGSLTEDIECSLRFHLAGKHILYLDGLECSGEVPHTSKDLYRQQMRWAYGVIYSMRKHFRALFASRRLTSGQKFSISIFGSGYLFSFLLLTLFVTGTMSFLTESPAPIDFAKFFAETGRNVLLTSGIILASMVALLRAKNLRKIASMVAASFSVGLLVTYYVNVGIIKVLFNRPMQWFMLRKDGNMDHV